MKSKHSVSVEQVFSFLQEKTPCCEIKNEQIKCSAAFHNHRYCYDLFIKKQQNDFSLVFIDAEEVKNPADILAEAGIFFTELNISEKNIIQRAGSVQVIVPSTKIVPVLKKLNIYCPQDDETILLPEDFTVLSKKQIDNKCLEIEDLDDFDENYNIV